LDIVITRATTQITEEMTTEAGPTSGPQMRTDIKLTEAAMAEAMMKGDMLMETKIITVEATETETDPQITKDIITGINHRTKGPEINPLTTGTDTKEEEET